MTSRSVITIDGLAASGKSTLARELAKKLGFAYLNSGLLYRAAALLVLQHKLSVLDQEGILRLLGQHQIQLQQCQSEAHVLIDGKQCGDQLHAQQVSETTSQIALHAGLRKLLVSLQREAFGSAALVAEGRDMGTVIFPEAQLKFYVSAELGVRAQRRAQQLGASAEEILKGLQERDQRDEQRSHAPTVAAKDAVLIDNSGQALTEVLENMYHLALQRGLGCASAGK